MEPRLLVIPHVFSEHLIVRDIELAKRLTAWFKEVYCLKWNDVYVDAGSAWQRRWRQLRNGVQALAATRRLTRGADGVTYAEVPTLQPILLHRLIGPQKALAMSRAFNTRVLTRAVRALGVNYVLLASATFNVPRVSGIKVFYDIIDWFSLEETTPRWKVEDSINHWKEVAARARGVFAVSQPLSEKLKTEYGINTMPLPNGADLTALRTVSSAQVETVRRRWGLEGKFVIGYIGNHGPFTGVDFVLEVFAALRRHIPNAALLIVGPASYWMPRIAKPRAEGVIFTGPVAPQEIPPYFHAIDMGILAQDKCAGTDLAFQIKVVEYSACRKFVLSTPLLTWQRLGWPNVMLVERQVDVWVKAIRQLKDAPWSPEWDTLVEPYDWRVIARRMARIMLDS
jgi:glycosyltransferase involved in cell wall biosynthesis